MMTVKKILLTLSLSLMTINIANAQTTNVTAVSTDIIGFFNTTPAGDPGALRTGGNGDHLLGNAMGTAFRNLVVLFDPADYQSVASDPTLMLTSAQLVMVENGVVTSDITSGTADIFAYFSNEANGGFNTTSPNSGNQGAAAGAGGFFGNTAARRGPHGGGVGGPNNVNASYAEGATVNSVSHTFVAGVDTITIDLAAGGISLADIQATLADDDTSNAGIFLDSPLTSQMRLANGFQLILAFEVADDPVILGDVDMSGEVNFLDIGPFIDVLSSGTFQAEADCNMSGEVDFLDIGPFIDILSGS